MTSKEPSGEDARGVVEDYLKLGTFFKRHQEHIFDKLEECDAAAEKAKGKKDMIFFAEGLPIINGLIHVGTTREEYRGALELVKSDWGEDVDPRTVLSALTFIYVVGEGARQRGPLSGEKEAIWKRIARRVAKLEPD